MHLSFQIMYVLILCYVQFLISKIICIKIQITSEYITRLQWITSHKELHKIIRYILILVHSNLRKIMTYKIIIINLK